MFPQADATVDTNKVLAALGEILTKNAGEFDKIQKAQTTGAPVGPYMHGPGGLFGVRGLERDIISTHTQIVGSLGEVLPIRSSADINPLFPYITGFLRSDQQEKNAVCDDPVEAGNAKTCIQTTQFGRKEFKTRQVEVNRIGQRINWAERTDLNLANSPLVNQMGGLMQGVFPNLSGANAFDLGGEMVMRFIEVAIAFQRWFCPTVYTGNPSNNSAGGGYKEFPGLDLLISTTKLDAVSGTACPSLYSDVKDFGYRQVDSSADPTLIKTLTTMMHVLRRKALTQNLAPVNFALVMRSDLFYYITEIWPCNYMSYRCFTFDQANIDPVPEFNTVEAIAMKNAMRDGSYLMIDNIRVPVIQDDCITEENQSDNAAIPISGFASDIYVVPLSARGGTLQTMYWQYFDYRGGPIDALNRVELPMWFWSDAGTFLWSMKAPDNWCMEAIAKTEPRLILLTPQLAGRLQNVVYVPLQHTDDPLPSQNYWVDGGISTGYPESSPYSEWNQSGPGIPA
jgi:hypothetical protein